MLPRTGGTQKPAVIGHVSEKIRATKSKLSRQFSNGILETNQGRDLAAVIGQLKHGKLCAGVEILRDLIADDFGKQGEGLAERDIFAERNKVDLAVQLRIALKRK